MDYRIHSTETRIGEGSASTDDSVVPDFGYSVKATSVAQITVSGAPLQLNLTLMLASKSF